MSYHNNLLFLNTTLTNQLFVFDQHIVKAGVVFGHIISIGNMVAHHNLITALVKQRTVRLRVGVPISHGILHLVEGACDFAARPSANFQLADALFEGGQLC